MSHGTPGRPVNSDTPPRPPREEDGRLPPVRQGLAPPAFLPAMPRPLPLHAPHPVAPAAHPPFLMHGPPGYQAAAAYYPQHLPPHPHTAYVPPPMQALQHGGHPHFLQYPFAGPLGLYHAQPPYPQLAAPPAAPQVAAPGLQQLRAQYAQRDTAPANAPVPPHPVQHGPNADNSNLPSSVSKRPRKRHYPNAQSRPGVWIFETGIAVGNLRRVFSTTTATTWDEFRVQALQKFGVPEKDVQMAWKLGGESARFLVLSDEADWKGVVDKIEKKALSAKTRTVTLEIKNIAKPPAEKPSSKKKKRARKDFDEASDPEVELTGAQRALETLRNATRCEAHNGHCWVRKGANIDNHMRMNHAQMTLWAKHISEGLATIFQPPNVHGFDPQPTRRARSSQGNPDVYVTMNFATPDQASHSSVPAAYTVSANGQERTVTVPCRSTVAEHMKLPYPLNGQSPPPGPPLPLPLLPKGWTSPYQRPGHRSPSPSPVAGPSRPKSARSLRGLQGVTLPRIMFPSIEHLTEHLQVTDPEYNYSELLEELNEMGYTDVQELLTIPVELLANMGNDLGQERAKNLRKCAKRILLPAFLGDSSSGSDSEQISDTGISRSAGTGEAPAKRRKVTTTPTDSSSRIKLESEDVELRWSDVDQEILQTVENDGGHSESSAWDGEEENSSWDDSEVDELEDDTN